MTDDDVEADIQQRGGDYAGEETTLTDAVERIADNLKDAVSHDVDDCLVLAIRGVADAVTFGAKEMGKEGASGAGALEAIGMAISGKGGAGQDSLCQAVRDAGEVAGEVAGHSIGESLEACFMDTRMDGDRLRTTSIAGSFEVIAEALTRIAAAIERCVMPKL